MYRKQVRRRRAVLALLIVGSFALLTLTYGQGSNSIQRGVTAIFTPISSVLDRALKPARDLINWVDETFDARGKNHRLETEVQALRKEVVGGKVALAENEELRALLKLEKSGAIPSEDGPVTGHVIGLSPTVWFSAVMIDVGSDDGVEAPRPGGQRRRPGRRSERGERRRLEGEADLRPLQPHRGAGRPGRACMALVKPTVGEPNRLVLGFLNSDKHLHKGEKVVTAGWHGEEIEGRFPPNIPVGEITKASIFEQEAQEQAIVRPYAELRNLNLLQVLTGGSRE